jgi:hypothetical protein
MIDDLTKAVPDISATEMRYCLEQAGVVDVHHWQVSRGWQFLGFSRKQPTNKNAKQDPTDQQAYLYLPPPAGVYGVNCQLIIDVDEFGTQLFNINRPLAHAPRGQKAVQVFTPARLRSQCWRLPLCILAGGFQRGCGCKVRGCCPQLRPAA